jgi:hypothetical protein
MKYDMVRIMSVAGAYRREGLDKSTALKAAWYEAKKETYRKAFNSTIREYVAQTEEKDYRTNYNNIYTIYKNITGNDVFEIAANSKLSKLDIVGAFNHEKAIYEIATEYVKLAS